MTAADRQLALARARRYRCPAPSCETTLPSRVQCTPRADGRYDVRVEVDPSAQLEHWVEQHLNATCDFCGRLTRDWPGRDCEEPEQHKGATYGCDCGDVVTIEDAIANPRRHRRCNLIGASA